MSVERIIVDKKIANEFIEKFVEHVKTLQVGNPRDKANVIGPIINERQRSLIHAQVIDAVEQGAELLTGGEYEGLYYQPTVLSNVNSSMKIYREENFGPVAPIITVAGGRRGYSGCKRFGVRPVGGYHHPK